MVEHFLRELTERDIAPSLCDNSMLLEILGKMGNFRIHCQHGFIIEIMHGMFAVFAHEVFVVNMTIPITLGSNRDGFTIHIRKDPVIMDVKATQGAVGTCC